ncbi:LPXTG cell wall anchor domain-containing protein [Brochothrix thermosphacta]|uniref:Gram-positive cocci surface proteins LPxTG domain-containing protein n=1 Tax=Brochothrix thermosphacta TaxID=2756 RepID=A0A2X0S714_BROTH|nr:LPXTG cell wall anchor domain-containing protein [Brochothrix thermosphacta]SPP28502.1 exported hypothetical protein [Brochothrix thermosphacta]
MDTMMKKVLGVLLVAVMLIPMLMNVADVKAAESKSSISIRFTNEGKDNGTDKGTSNGTGSDNGKGTGNVNKSDNGKGTGNGDKSDNGGKLPVTGEQTQGFILLMGLVCVMVFAVRIRQIRVVTNKKEEI